MSIVPPPQPTSVYRYYDTHGVLIYVGITSRGTRRNREHNESKDWWQFVSRQEVDHYPDRPAATLAEKRLIRDFAPPFNRQHNPGHDHIRAAYLLFAAAEAQPVSWRKALKEMGYRIELDVHEQTKERLVLRTRLEDSAIALAMRQAEQGIRVFGFRKHKHVKQLVTQGPVCLIELHSGSEHPIASAYANVRYGGNGRFLTLRNVHLQLDHSSRRHCTRYCPEPRRSA